MTKSDDERFRIKVTVAAAEEGGDMHLQAESLDDYVGWVAALRAHADYANYMKMMKSRFSIGAGASAGAVGSRNSITIGRRQSANESQGQGLAFNSFDIDRKSLVKYDLPFVNYHMYIYSATGLAAADGPLQKSDPYVIVKWNGVEVGRTPYVKQTLDPVWADPMFKLSHPLSDSAGQSVLQVEVWDFDLIGSHDFLGGYEITGNALQQLMSTAVASPGEVAKCSWALGPVHWLDKNKQGFAGSGSIRIGIYDLLIALHFEPHIKAR